MAHTGKKWGQIRLDLLEEPRTCYISHAINRSLTDTFILLYEVAGWFRTVGKYGVLHCDATLIDTRYRCPGLAAAMKEQGWLREHNGRLTLAGYTNVSALRKSLGSKLRRSILQGATCTKCGTAENLVVDHIIPVSKGGSSELDNLQPLCWGCNAKKGANE